jgi:dTDP-4-amino-4,6-dideoxygalactose transaminase
MADRLIPLADPGAAFMAHRETLLEAVARSFDTGRYILGEEVETFEYDFARYLGLAHVVGCASGTDALELVLRGLGVGPGKAVFTVSHTAVATVAAIERAGGVPVVVDIDPASYTMDPVSLEEAIAHIRSKHPELAPAVVIPVHLYGHPCDMDAILNIGDKYACPVVEDCAQAHGARYKGRIAGSMGMAAAFSFYPTKNLGALGDAGAAATNDSSLAERMRALRQYGWKERYISDAPGINSRLDPVQAAVLAVRLRHLEDDNAARRRVAAVYNIRLASCGLALPATAARAEHAFHLYVARCRERSTFMDFLRARNIASAIHYPRPVHLQPAYRGRIALAPGGLPVTEGIMGEVVSLPLFPQLGDEDVGRVCAVVREWAKADG